MSRLLIGVDIDGVLFPWCDVANETVMAKFGVPDPGPHVTWTHLRDVLLPAQWRWLWTAEGQDAVFSQVDRTYPEAVAAINVLLKAGHLVHFVTHRDPRRTAITTACFLERHFRAHPWAGVHVVQNNVAKRTLARWDAFVDDKPETVLDMVGNSTAQVFAPVRPWNEAALHPVGLSGFGARLTHYDDPTAIVAWANGGA